MKTFLSLFLLFSTIVSIAAAAPSLRSRRQHKAQGGASAELWEGAKNNDRSPRSGRQRMSEMVYGCRSLRELGPDCGALPRADALGFMLPPAPQAEGNAHNEAFQQAEGNAHNEASQSDVQTGAALAAYQKAEALFREQKLEQSLAAVEEALRLNPKLVPALTLKARLAMAANRFDVARGCLQQAVEIEPNSAGNQFLFGFALYFENDFAHALAPLERAVRLKPDDARTQFYLALTFEGLGRTDEAIAGYERALKLDGENGAQLADTLVAYARLLFTLGRYDDSEKLVDRALTVEADSRDAQYEKGRLRFERRDYAAAIKHGKKALGLPGAGTTERQIHYLLARAYALAGPKELAEYHLAKFRAAPPTLRR